MIYSMDGHIVSIDGNVFERVVKQLTYQIKGGWFPQSWYNFGQNTNVISGNEYIEFISDTPNTITVNYGDGSFVIKEFVLVAGKYKVGYHLSNSASWVIPQKKYNDGFAEMRNIVFSFEKPLSISKIHFNWVQLRGITPIETIEFSKLKTISYQGAGYLEDFADNFPPNLDVFNVSTALAVKKTKIPDTIFETKTSNLSISDSFNLSDIISSNFFKIGQLKETLNDLRCNSNNLQSLPDSITECQNLQILTIELNLFKRIPSQLNALNNLRLINLGVLQSTADQSLPVWDNLQKLQSVHLQALYLNLNDIPHSWKYLYSLNYINFIQERFINTTERFDLFINNLYLLCTQNGSITPNGSPAPYPNRFRNIASGLSTLTFTGAKVAPVGYVQGVSNGNPATPGEKVYVLQNQYNHVITHA